MSLAPVRVAVIPAAGLGTRFLPVSKTVPKELLPLVDVPIVDNVIAEAVAAGCDEVIVVSAPGKEPLDRYFEPNQRLEARLGAEDREGDLALARRGEALAKMKVVHQDSPRGNGDAVLRAREAVAGRPFLMIWGDDIVFADPGVGSQLVRARERTGGGSVGAVMRVAPADARRYGIVEGDAAGDRTWRVKRIVEKPERPASDLAVVHAYVLEPEIFDVLAALPPGRGGEIWLTDAVNELAQRRPVYAYEFEGERFDAGDRLGYAKAFIRAALRREGIGEELREWLRGEL